MGKPRADRRTKGGRLEAESVRFADRMHEKDIWRSAELLIKTAWRGTKVRAARHRQAMIERGDSAR
jgi:hypothetical protein